MAFLQESEWMFLNEIAYNISFIYSFDDMRKTVLDRLNMLIAFDGAVFSLVDNHEVTNSVSYNIDDKNIDLYEKIIATEILFTGF